MIVATLRSPRLGVIAALALVAATTSCAQGTATLPSSPTVTAQATATPTAAPIASPTQASRPAIAITLTNSACTAEGLGDVLQRRFAAEVVNTTASRVAVNLQRLNDGRQYAELESFIQARQRAIAAGGDIDAQPPMTTIVIRVLLAAGGRGNLEGELAAGTYGLVCRRDSASDFSVASSPAQAIYLRGPLRVD
jgi:hypothetical protein